MSATPETTADWYQLVTGTANFATTREQALAEAHVRERAARPEDVETVAEVIWVPYRNSFGCKTDFTWSAAQADAGWSRDVQRICACAQAIVKRYGPPPAIPQITDADVERCAEALWPWLRNGISGYRHLVWAQISAEGTGHCAAIAAARAALTAFLNPPSPDPIQAALDRAAAQVRDAGGVWNETHERAVRAVLEERKDRQ